MADRYAFDATQPTNEAQLYERVQLPATMLPGGRGLMPPRTVSGADYRDSQHMQARRLAGGLIPDHTREALKLSPDGYETEAMRLVQTHYLAGVMNKPAQDVSRNLSQYHAAWFGEETSLEDAYASMLAQLRISDGIRPRPSMAPADTRAKWVQSLDAMLAQAVPPPGQSERMLTNLRKLDLLQYLLPDAMKEVRASGDRGLIGMVGNAAAGYVNAGGPFLRPEFMMARDITFTETAKAINRATAGLQEAVAANPESLRQLEETSGSIAQVATPAFWTVRAPEFIGGQLPFFAVGFGMGGISAKLLSGPLGRIIAQAPRWLARAIPGATTAAAMANVNANVQAGQALQQLDERTRAMEQGWSNLSSLQQATEDYLFNLPEGERAAIMGAAYRQSQQHYQDQIARGNSPEVAAQMAAGTYWRTLPINLVGFSLSMGTGSTLFRQLGGSSRFRQLATAGGILALEATAEAEEELWEDEVVNVELAKALTGQAIAMDIMPGKVYEALTGDDPQAYDTALVALMFGAGTAAHGALQQLYEARSLDELHARAATLLDGFNARIAEIEKVLPDEDAETETVDVGLEVSEAQQAHEEMLRQQHQQLTTLRDSLRQYANSRDPYELLTALRDATMDASTRTFQALDVADQDARQQIEARRQEAERELTQAEEDEIRAGTYYRALQQMASGTLPAVNLTQEEREFAALPIAQRTAQVQQAIATVAAVLDPGRYRYTIADRLEDLPAHVQQELQQYGPGAMPEAFVDPQDGTIWIYTPAMRSPAMAKEKLIHEIAHRELMRYGRPAYNERMAELYDLAGIENIETLIRETGGGAWLDAQLAQEQTPQRQALIAEEYAARLAEKIISAEELTAAERSLWQRILDVLRNVLPGAKLQGLDGTEPEIAEFVRGLVLGARRADFQEQPPLRPQQPQPEAKFKPGQTVEFQLRKGSATWHTGTVQQIVGDGTLQVEFSRRGNESETRFIPEGDMREPAGQEAARRYREDVAAAADPAQVRADSRAFDDLLRDHALLFLTEEGARAVWEGDGMADARAAAMQALGLDADPTLPTARADALDALKAYIEAETGTQIMDAPTDAEGPADVPFSLSDDLQNGRDIDNVPYEQKVPPRAESGPAVRRPDGTRAVFRTDAGRLDWFPEYELPDAILNQRFQRQAAAEATGSQIHPVLQRSAYDVARRPYYSYSHSGWVFHDINQQIIEDAINLSTYEFQRRYADNDDALTYYAKWGSWIRASDPAIVGLRFSISSEQDAAYLQAVEAGDMDTAQRLVDEAAEAAGYTVGPVWHGSPKAGITRFDSRAVNEFRPEKYSDSVGVIWAHSEKAEATEYASGRTAENPRPSRSTTRPTGRVYPIYLKMETPHTFLTQGMGASIGDRRAAIEEARKQNRDSVIIEHGEQEVDDDGNLIGDAEVEAKEFAIFSPDQIKSADPVTYDDAGNVIPLSERFNPQSDDIRFSLADITPAERRELLSSRLINTAPKITVTKLYRGESETTGTHSAAEGQGLYMTGDRDEAARYGEVRELPLSALPKRPLQADTYEDFREWLQRAAFQTFGFRNIRDFNRELERLADGDVAYIVRQLGFNGVMIGKGASAAFVRYPEQPGEQVRFSISSEQDAAYLQAVEAGDMDTAQRMVDQAAEAAGYTIGPVWHGTDANWTSYDTMKPPGYGRTPVTDAGLIHLTPDRDYAARYGTPQRFFVRASSPAVEFIKKGQQGLRDGDVDAIVTAPKWNPFETAQPTLSEIEEIVVRDPNQIKSADPVTYDDAGNVIPLSERFNPQSDDIRFSLRGQEAMNDPARLAAAWIAGKMIEQNSTATRQWLTETRRLVKPYGLEKQAAEIVDRAQRIAQDLASQRQALVRQGERAIMDAAGRQEMRRFVERELAEFERTTRAQAVSAAMGEDSLKRQQREDRQRELAERQGLSDEQLAGYGIDSAEIRNLITPSRQARTEDDAPEQTEQEPLADEDAELTDEDAVTADTEETEETEEAPPQIPTERWETFRDNVLEAVRKRMVKEGVFTDATQYPERNATYRVTVARTFARLITDAAQTLTYGQAREQIQARAREIASASQYPAMMRKVEATVRRLNEQAIRGDRKTWLARIDKLLKTAKLRGPENRRTELKDREITPTARRWLRLVKDVRGLSAENTQNVLDQTKAILGDPLEGTDEQTDSDTPKDPYAQLAGLLPSLKSDPHYSANREDAVRDIYRAILAYGGLNERSVAEVAAAHEQLVADLTGGIDAMEAYRTQRRERLAPIRETQIAAVQAPQKALGQVPILGSLIYTTWNRLRDMYRYASEDVRNAAMAQRDELWLRTQRANEIEQTRIRQAQERFVQEIQRIYGVTGTGAVQRIIRDLERPREAYAKYSRGYTHKNVLSKSNLMYMVAHLEQHNASGLRETERKVDILPDDQQRDADYLEELYTELSAQDIELLDWMRDTFSENREALSAVSLQEIGLPVASPDPRYFPFRVRRTDSSLAEEHRMAVIVPPMLERRVVHRNDLDETASALGVWTEQTRASAHFIAFAEISGDLRSIFGYPQLKRAIEENHGQKPLRGLLEAVTDIINGGYRQPSDDAAAFVNHLRGFTTLMALHMNVFSGLKQTVSIFTPGLEVGLGLNAKAITQWATAPEENMQALREILASDQLKNRMQRGPSEGVANAMSEAQQAQFVAMRTRLERALVEGVYQPWMRWMRANMWTITLGDATPIAIVGPGLYRAFTAEHLARGMSEEQAKADAMSRMFAAMEATQQSSNVDMLNRLQRREGVLGKTFMQFLSSVSQQAQYPVITLREARAGTPGARKRLATAIAITHIITPALMAAVNALRGAFRGEDEDEDAWRETVATMILGPWGGIPLVGGMLDTAIRQFLGARTWQGGLAIQRAFEPAIDAGEILFAVYRLLTGDVEDGEIAAALDAFVDTVNPAYRDISKAVENRTDD